MEKVIAALWAPEGEDHAAYGARLLATLPSALAAGGAQAIRMNVRSVNQRLLQTPITRRSAIIRPPGHGAGVRPVSSRFART